MSLTQSNSCHAPARVIAKARWWMRAIILGTLLLLNLLPSFAGSEPAAEFDAANKLYAETKFADAAAAYEKLAQSGVVSPALLFNLGNAYYKSGQVGRCLFQVKRLSGNS